MLLAGGQPPGHSAAVLEFDCEGDPNAKVKEPAPGAGEQPSGGELTGEDLTVAARLREVLRQARRTDDRPPPRPFRSGERPSIVRYHAHRGRRHRTCAGPRDGR